MNTTTTTTITATNATNANANATGWDTPPELQQVYIPAAVWSGDRDAGGGGPMVSVEEAMALGALTIDLEKGTATWPQHFWDSKPIKVIRTQGRATGHGWYQHLYYAPELGRGVVKIVHGDEPWWPVSFEEEPQGHNLGTLLADIREGQSQEELSTLGWKEHCFVFGNEYDSESRVVQLD